MLDELLREPPDYVALAIPVFFIMISGEILFSWRRRAGYYRINDTISNMSAAGIEQLFSVFAVSAVFGLYVVLYEGWRLPWPPAYIETKLASFAAQFPLHAQGAALAIAVILFDHQYYWYHRCSHRVNLAWAGHVTHHSSEEYNFSVALRQSPTSYPIQYVFYMPLAIVGVHPIAYLLAAQINTIYQFFVHTRAVARLDRELAGFGPVGAWFGRAIEYVFNTPSAHRVHHGRNAEYLDKNYGGIFIIWDRLYATYTREEEAVEYGVTEQPNSWNPFWIQFHHYAAIVGMFRRGAGASEKLKALFAPPGWRPKKEAEAAPRPGVGPRAKFDPAIPARYRGYAVFQFISTALPAYYTFLVFAGGPPGFAFAVIACGGFMLLSLYSIGLILNGSPWACTVEIVRILSGGALLSFAGPDLVSQTAVLLAGTLAMLLAALWTLFPVRGGRGASGGEQRGEGIQAWK